MFNYRGSVIIISSSSVECANGKFLMKGRIQILISFIEGILLKLIMWWYRLKWMTVDRRTEIGKVFLVVPTCNSFTSCHSQAHGSTSQEIVREKNHTKSGKSQRKVREFYFESGKNEILTKMTHRIFLSIILLRP